MKDRTDMIMHTSMKIISGTFFVAFSELTEKVSVIIELSIAKMIMAAATTIDGTIHFELTYGSRNLPSGAESSRGGNTNTPPHTSVNANSVPILVKSRMNVRSVKKIGIPTTSPVIIVANAGVLYFG